MGTLGKLKKTGVTYKGLIEGITFGPVPVVISPIAKVNPEAPDYRVYRGQSEVGAAWKKKTQEGNRYLIVTLDDPASRHRSNAGWCPMVKSILSIGPDLSLSNGACLVKSIIRDDTEHASRRKPPCLKPLKPFVP